MTNKEFLIRLAVVVVFTTASYFLADNINLLPQPRLIYMLLVQGFLLTIVAMAGFWGTNGQERTHE